MGQGTSGGDHQADAEPKVTGTMGGGLAFIATLIVMVFVHELGHLLTAKKFGMKVESFYFGFGPKLFSFRRKETEYGMRVLPLGGYVKIAGMNPFIKVPEEDAPRAFNSKPAWQRAIVLAAGSTTHFILATIVLTAMFSIVGIPVATTTISEVNERANGVTLPAKSAGFSPGDKIISLDGRRLKDWAQFQKYVSTRPNQQLTLTLERGTQQLTIQAAPAEVEVETAGGGKRKVGILGLSPKEVSVHQSPPVALWSGLKGTGQFIAISVEGIGRIFSPHGIAAIFGSLQGQGQRGADEPVGLVGATRAAGQAASAGRISDLIQFLAGFIVFVGVINLVPLPILDGGYLAVIAFEKLFRRKVDMRKLVPVGALVFGFLIVLVIVLLYLDIARPIANPFQ